MSARDDFTARIPGDDAGLVVLALLGTYLAYVPAGVVLGYTLRGQLNSIATLTFYTGVFTVLSLALNLYWGYTGLFNIGVVDFMAVGVYVTAIVTKPTYVAGDAAQADSLSLPLWVGILADVTTAALLGLMVAFPALRLRADYLAIVTIVMSEIVWFSFLSGELQQFQLFGNRVGFGSGSGLILDFSPSLEALLRGVGLWNECLSFVGAFQALVPRNPKPVVDGLIYGLLFLGFIADFYWLLKRIGESPFGRMLKAIRENEDVVNALGKNTDRFKIGPFVLGYALVGLAGILWLVPRGAVTPNFFRSRVTFFIRITFVIGGAGSDTGSVLGGVVFAAVLYQGPRYFQNLVSAVFPNFDSPSGLGQAISPFTSQSDPVPFLLYTVDSIRQLQLVMMGPVLIWLMHNRPEGMLGYRKETASVIPLSRPKSTAADGGVDAAAGGGETDE